MILFAILGVLALYPIVGLLSYRSAWIEQAKAIKRGTAPGWRNLNHWNACRAVNWARPNHDFKACTCNWNGTNMSAFTSQPTYRNEAGFWKPWVLAALWPLRAVRAVFRVLVGLLAHLGFGRPFQAIAAWFHPELEIPDSKVIEALERSELHL